MSTGTWRNQFYPMRWILINSDFITGTTPMQTTVDRPYSDLIGVEGPNDVVVCEGVYYPIGVYPPHKHNRAFAGRILLCYDEHMKIKLPPYIEVPVHPNKVWKWMEGKQPVSIPDIQREFRISSKEARDVVWLLLRIHKVKPGIKRAGMYRHPAWEWASGGEPTNRSAKFVLNADAKRKGEDVPYDLSTPAAEKVSDEQLLDAIWEMKGGTVKQIAKAVGLERSQCYRRLEALVRNEDEYLVKVVWDSDNRGRTPAIYKIEEPAND